MKNQLPTPLNFIPKNSKMKNTTVNISTQIQRNIFIKQATQFSEFSRSDDPKTILFSFSHIEKTISLKDIIRLEAASSYTLFYVKGLLKPLLKSKPLKYYGNILGTDQFIRVHQSHLINKSYIQSYWLKRKPIVTLTDGSEISISRRKLTLLKRNYMLL